MTDDYLSGSTYLRNGYIPELTVTSTGTLATSNLSSCFTVSDKKFIFIF